MFSDNTITENRTFFPSLSTAVVRTRQCLLEIELSVKTGQTRFKTLPNHEDEKHTGPRPFSFNSRNSVPARDSLYL